MDKKTLHKLQSQLRVALSKSHRSLDEEKREAMAVTIETELPVWLREAFGVEVEAAFDLTSASLLCSYRNKIASNAVASRINAESDGRFDHALKLYIDFLDSKFNPLKKKPKAVKPVTAIEPEAETPTFVEGASVQQTVDRRERNPLARQACIEKYGCKCVVCGFDFEAVYGAVGSGYIEVHHLKPISLTDDEHEVTADDLVPLCANCHAMVHRRSPIPFTVEELKRFMGLNV